MKKKQQKNIRKTAALNKEFLSEYKSDYKKIELKSNKIRKRIEYIAKIITKEFNHKYDYFEANNFEADIIMNDKFIECVFVGRDSYWAIRDKYGKEMELGDYIPTRWLTEDFEQELIDGKKLQDEADEKQHQLMLMEKAKRDIAEVKKTLNKSQLKELGIQ